MMIKGEGASVMKMKERVEWFKQWFQLYKKQLMIGVLALIVMFIAGVFAFNYQLKKVFNQAITYYQENDLFGFEEIRYDLYAQQGEAFDAFLTQEALETFEKFKELDEDNRIYWGKNGDSVPALKIFENVHHRRLFLYPESVEIVKVISAVPSDSKTSIATSLHS